MRIVNLVIACITLFAFSTQAIFAGGTPNQQWLPQNALNRANGDYVSATGGGQYVTTNKYYAYFIEVPPGSTRLVVEIYDPNIFENPSGTIGEIQLGGSWNTQTSYTLRNPSGTVVATLTGTNAATPNQTWVTLADINNPANGHWELRVQVVTGDDVNIYGIRAHDGDPSANGREYNVYAESYFPIGIPGNPIPDPKTHVFYPYVISGCSLLSMDFDFDGNPNNSMSFASPDNSFTQNLASTQLSGAATASGTGNDGWAFNTITYSGFRNLYGLWTQTVQIGGTNQATCLVGNDAHGATAPTTQPEANTFRLYFPTDGGTKPSKPTVTQTATYVAGFNPPVQGLITFYQLTFTINNPTPYPITFSSSNIFQSFVPGNTGNAQVVYAGNLSVSQGTVISQPSVGSSGNVQWNPGVVAANSSATISYRVRVTPTSCPNAINLTGTGSNATSFRFLDETGNSSQARATLTIGGLCVLQTPQCQVTTSAGVVVAGRVMTPSGRGLSGAVVRMTDGSGNTRYTYTSTFGYYRFLDVPAGETYTFEVISKRYVFSPQTLTVLEDVSDLNFYAEGYNNKPSERY
ncbi:MAG: hypothetical protein KatS3mg006_0515 [Pyrinomonadaceae bacterium]|nr:MAG: hypothetical protein KatS3mg006_0515 [Pyrinomonadaceae bacterium]